MRLVHLAKAPEQRADVVPLDVVTERMAKEFLGSEAMVMVQLD
jgi:hypothetical protein